MRPYKSVGHKTMWTRFSILILGLGFLGLLNYVIFWSPREYLIISSCITAVFGYGLYKILHLTKDILYEFTPNAIIIHYDTNKSYTIAKEEIGRVRRIMRTGNYIGISRHNNVITKEKYFTTSKNNMIGIYMRDQTTIIISPRVVKKWVFKYYDSTKLLHRF